MHSNGASDCNTLLLSTGKRTRLEVCSIGKANSLKLL
jgi:hypothetical protein